MKYFKAKNTTIGIVKNESSIQNINKRKICNQALSSKKSKLDIPFEENIPDKTKHLKEQDIPLIGQGKNIKPVTKPKVETKAKIATTKSPDTKIKAKTVNKLGMI